MPRFFTGDELGAIKLISYTLGEDGKEWKGATTVLAPASSSKSKTTQKLALHSAGPDTLLASVRADGSASLHQIQDDSQLTVVHEWSESKLKEGQCFVGLAMTKGAVYSCTSNGALRLTKVDAGGSEPSSSTAALPMRLCEWRLSEGGEAFAYGGDEVELSLWDTEKAFSQQPSVSTTASIENKKRKRDEQLLPAELWRAKNVPNDHLSLRQPVHNTTLAFLQPSTSAAHQHILAGTANGNVRRYDTRAGRRPVSDWKGIGKSGGIQTVEKGHNENEVFVADRGCMLSALDLRNGRTIYTYKGISGAVTSIAPARSFVASVSQDRFVRLQSTFGPPAEAGQQQEQKGEVLEKTYMKVVPTAIVWDGSSDAQDDIAQPDDDAADDVWDAMDAAENDSEDEGVSAQPKEKKTRTT